MQTDKRERYIQKKKKDREIRKRDRERKRDLDGGKDI